MLAGTLHPLRLGPRRRPGLTLLETLLAVSLAALVVVLVYASYRTALAVREGQRRREGGRAAAAQALRTLARDLACSLDEAAQDGCPFVLSEDRLGPDRFSAVSFCSAVRPEGEDDLAWFEIRRLVFRIADEGGARRLLRESQPLVGPQADVAQTNVLVERVSVFRIEAFDGQTWTNQWPREGAGGCPQAARVTLSLSDTAVTSLSTEVWIPAALIVTSRVERSGQRQP